MAVLIEATGLEKSFGDIKAVDGISLEREKGRGAGVSRPQRRRQVHHHEDADRLPGAGRGRRAHRRLRRAGAAQGRPRRARLPARRCAALRRNDAARVARVRRRDPRLRARARPGVASRLRWRGPGSSRCSSSASRRCPRASSAASGWPRPSCTIPEVLIMDEPTDGLDPNQKHHVRKLIAEMAKEKAIIVSTHILEEVEAVCTRAVVINRGPHRRRRHGRGPDAARALSRRGRAPRRGRQGRCGDKALRGLRGHCQGRDGSASANGQVAAARHARERRPASPPTWPR